MRNRVFFPSLCLDSGEFKENVPPANRKDCLRANLGRPGPCLTPIVFVMGTPFYTMDPNTGYPAGFPVPTQSPPNPMSFYQNSMPQQFPQSKAPSQPGQQQHSFANMPMQPGVPGGAMMPSGFPQQSAGTLVKSFPPFTPSCRVLVHSFI